jgi:hypothetical protein
MRNNNDKQTQHNIGAAFGAFEPEIKRKKKKKDGFHSRVCTYES